MVLLLENINWGWDQQVLVSSRFACDGDERQDCGATSSRMSTVHLNKPAPAPAAADVCTASTKLSCNTRSGQQSSHAGRVRRVQTHSRWPAKNQLKVLVSGTGAFVGAKRLRQTMSVAQKGCSLPPTKKLLYD
ncbi:uncharacterized protein UMAG_02096 [Mycosarcoma maydis]|uniref:Uncharacterized protein n=1 Tax=Mycosarcoma maydis TaxID=5270 RepID=A0A0D1E013_MYCMD|nr:uncharacterized protein UMAG_02096 [Ustilago maydis 521]KIS69559.1 hypothetical protein UMAG_02096 [Ustilago maydis 521]|eukprot:XP_011388464.1 hypothetical protein UMAG_02096 [Ustilago maydis 521]